MRMTRVEPQTTRKGAPVWCARENGETEKTMLVALKCYLDQAGIRLANEEDGQGLIEYVLMAGFISVVAIVAIQLTGTNVSALWDAVAAATTP
jgi:Flp pilus assembly pilin Flp